MSRRLSDESIEAWLGDVRAHVAMKAPDLLELLDTYIGEARFGRRYVAPELARLSPSARILEVGAGAMLLSCQLRREGFEVTALEPFGGGFSHFVRMQALVLERARALGCLPRILDCPAEKLTETAVFEFAFSVNVMEHVDNVKACIVNVCASIRPGARYRFTCPNYLFPYEPHFNIPTLFSKQVTEKLLGRKIFRGGDLSALRATWNSLNWINVRQIRRIVAGEPALKVSFDRRFLIGTLERVVADPVFASRRSSWLRAVSAAMVKSRLHYLVRLVPAMCQPIVDCTIMRTTQGAA